MKVNGPFLIITKKKLMGIFFVLIMLVAGITVPSLWEQARRSWYGVKPGVTLEGHDLSGLLEHELYDAVASLAEGHYVEAKNATWDWTANRLQEERVGFVIDIKATVDALLAAPPNTQGEMVTIPILPSITSAHFKPIYRGPTVEPKMSLMVNVDWGDEFIPDMLAIFARFNVTTTWFPTGRWVEKSPEMAKAIADAGHEIGNHGGWHGYPSKMSRDEVRRLILEGEERIVDVTGQKPTIFAPPAGDMDEQTVAIAGELGYKTVLWTIDTVDWRRPAPTVIVDRVVGKAANGALVLMHPTQPTTEALPVILETLQNKGYQLVTVSELLAE